MSSVRVEVVKNIRNVADLKGIPQTCGREIIVGIRADIESIWELSKEEFNLDRLL